MTKTYEEIKESAMEGKLYKDPLSEKLLRRRMSSDGRAKMLAVLAEEKRKNDKQSLQNKMRWLEELNINIPEGAKAIPLTRGKYTLVDEEDYEWLMQLRWFAYCGKYTFYAVRSSLERSDKRQNIKMHRLIMNCPKGMVVDHINHDGLDNRKKNLRICSHSENNRYCRKSYVGNLYKGVSLLRGRWQVNIRANNRSIYLGIYDSQEDAARVYDEAALKYHGEFAMTNKMLGLI